MKKMIGVAAAVLISAPAAQAALHQEKDAQKLTTKEVSVTTKEASVTPHQLTVAAGPGCLPGVAMLPSCRN